MNRTSAQRLNLPTAQANLAELCRYVTDQNQRLEIECGGPNDTCVLISKTELQTLERALEIYAGTEDAMELREKVTELCRLAAEESREVPATVAI